jgi:hypothetical protein
VARQPGLSANGVGATGPAAGLRPYLAGSLVWGIGLSLNGTTEYAINPSRDLGPRIVHAILPIAGAVQFAALLWFVYGKADNPFDWDRRPFFVRFNTPDRSEREAVFVDLCQNTGVASSDYL